MDDADSVSAVTWQAPLEIQSSVLSYFLSPHLFHSGEQVLGMLHALFPHIGECSVVGNVIRVFLWEDHLLEITNSLANSFPWLSRLSSSHNAAIRTGMAFLLPGICITS